MTKAITRLYRWKIIFWYLNRGRVLGYWPSLLQWQPQGPADAAAISAHTSPMIRHNRPCPQIRQISLFGERKKMQQAQNVAV